MPNARRQYSNQNWNRAESNRRSQSQSSAGSRQGGAQEQSLGQYSGPYQGSGSGSQANSNLASYQDNIIPLQSTYLAPFVSFFSEIDKVFNKSLRNFGMPALPDIFEGQSAFSPNVDIVSNENEYIITAECPGMDERDLRVEVSVDGTLCISGVKRQENQERSRNIECVECSYGAFERNLSLPEDACREDIEANFRNGVLTISCPRVEGRRSQSRPIAINGNAGGSERGSAGGSERGGAAERAGASAQERSGIAGQERGGLAAERAHEKSSQGPKRAA